jgi:hypothetical protein
VKDDAKHEELLREETYTMGRIHAATMIAGTVEIDETSSSL